MTGYYSLISLPMGHSAADWALGQAAQKDAMKNLTRQYKGVRAARMRTKVGELDRTLVVVESPTLLEGQKRGIEARLVFVGAKGSGYYEIDESIAQTIRREASRLGRDGDVLSIEPSHDIERCFRAAERRLLG